ncbi:MAG: hypothetical protein OEZ01_03465, partial [Candidatus Heimdallarchaeota archaeon]|nr:hypothetical protein [Candidatus Heimdallarchaeota archaeon]
MIDDSILENYVSKIPTITLDRKLKMSPIQTIYGGAHLFSSSSIQKLGHIAKTTFAENLSNHEQLRHFIKGITATEKLSLLSNQSIFQTEEKFFKILYDRVINKLNSSAVEDLRIDFEDGFGIRSDEEEDMECSRAAAELILMIKSNTMPQKIGIRIKSLTSNPRRSLKTLYLFLSTVLNMAVLPQNFVVTIPKIRSPREIEVLDEFLSMIENKFGLENKIPIELL